MSADFVARLIGMIVFSILGVYLGTHLGRLANETPGEFVFSVEQYAFTIGMVGALIGLILTPYLTTRPIKSLRMQLSRLSTRSLLASLIGRRPACATSLPPSRPLAIRHCLRSFRAGCLRSPGCRGSRSSPIPAPPASTPGCW